MGWTSVATAGIVLTCLALFFEVVAFAIPFWFSHVYTLKLSSGEKDLGLYMNVWYAMACYPGDTGSCESAAIKPNFTGTSIPDGVKLVGIDPDTLSASAVVLFGLSPHWRVIQIITTVSVGLVMLAGLIMICSRCMGAHSQASFLITIICLLLSGITAIGIACFNAYANAKLLDFIHTDYLTSKTFPYSILIFGIGGVICLLAALILMMVVHKWDRYGAYKEDDSSEFEDDVPMSKVSSSRERGMDNPRYGYDQPRRDYSSYDRTRNGYSDRSRYDDGHRRDYDQGHSRGNRDYYGDSRRDYRENDYYYGQSRKEDIYRPHAQYRY